MSLFQCSRCGCEENTACSNMSRPHFWNEIMGKDERAAAALASYREILGMAPGEPFGELCSACSPAWIDPQTRDYGVGPNPNPKPGEGMWHGEWPQKFLPLGEYMTDPRTGNLVRKDEYVEPPPPPPRRYWGTGERVPIHMENPHFTEAQNRAARRAAERRRRR